MTVPFIFADQDGPVPLNELDENFSYFDGIFGQLNAAVQTSATIPGNHVGFGAPPIAESLGLSIIRTSTNAPNNIGFGWQFQRYFDQSETFSGVKEGVRVVNFIGDSTHGGSSINMGSTYSISGEATMYEGLVYPSGGGATSVAGTTFKYSTTGEAWAGVFQVKTYAIFSNPTDVTPAVGIEINQVSIGLDHPTANFGYGNKFLLNLIAKSDTTFSASPGYALAEYGAGIYLRHGDAGGTGTTEAYMRYGIIVDDMIAHAGTQILTKDAINLSTFGQTGLHIKGGNTTAQIFLEDPPTGVSDGYAAYGIIINGSNYTSGSAIRVHDDMFIALNASNTVRMKYNSTSKNIEFYNGATLVGHLVVNGGADHAI